MGQTDSLPSKLNVGEKDELEVRGYRSHPWKWACTVAVIVLTFGLFGVFLVWRKDIKMALFYQECPLHEATVILLKDSFGQFFQEKIHRQESKDPSMKSLPYSRYFYNKKIKYFWDAGIMQFVKFQAFDVDMTCDVFYDRIDEGIDPPAVQEMWHLYGQNLIEIVVPPVYRMILKEVSNPFYMFQLYTVIVWMAERYFDYCAMVITGTVLAVGSSVYETRKQMVSLRKKMYVTGTVKVLRGGVEKTIQTSELVPGDLIYIKPDEPQLLHCDAVIIEGSCSVDESMLTGESYPITKIPVPKDPMTTFSYQEHKRHILFCGTQLLQGRCEGHNIYLKAVVIRTGYMSGKGELIRAILYPKPIHFRFYQDLVKVACLFFAIGFGGMIYSMYTWIANGAYVYEIILNSLDIVTFVVPPLLPAGLTACAFFAQKRLKKQHVFCLSSKHISLSGGVDVICFDKTGTLTESDIDLAAAVPIQEGELRHPVVEIGTLPESYPLLTAMSTCHSLIQINGNLSGYSIDRKMFEATGWTFKEGPVGVNSEYGIETPFLVSSPLWSRDRESTFNPTTELAILKRIPFESSLKRMTVIVSRKNHERFQVVVKGAPETIARICDPVTVPSNYDAVLKHYTIQGYRVLALAMKDLSPHLTWNHVRKLNREELESHVELVGLLIVQNQLKKESLPTIDILHDANISTVMVTGDNLQTAITVAKDCRMIDRTQKIIQVEAFLVPASIYGAQHLKVVYKDPMAAPEFFNGTVRRLRDVHSSNFCLTMDGLTFDALRNYEPVLLERIVVRAKVFARMAPEDKQRLIEILQRLGRQVAMVGDGCNDCGALRTADAGISLSMADASVAAPFTSQDTNISCILPLIREGRNTLDSAFGAFQFATSICFIFFIGVLMLYSISSEPSDFQYFIWDFGIVTIPFFFIGNVAPAECLHRRRPLRHLWAFLPLFSFFTFLMWQTVVLLVGWFYCHAQVWFTPNVFEPGRFPPNPCYEETTIYLLSCIGSIVAALVFAPSPPYSRSILTNKIFCAWAVFASILMTCITFVTEPSFADWMNFKTFPETEYTVVIYFLGVGAGILCYVWEKYFVREWLYLWLIPRVNKFRRPRHMYQKIEKDLKSEPHWPNMEDEELQVGYHQIDTEGPSTPSHHLSENPGFLQAQNTPRSPSRSSIRGLFRTFHGSRRGGYTINGPKMKDEVQGEGIPMTPRIARTAGEPLAVAVEEDAEAGEYLELPPPIDDFQSAESDLENSAVPARISPGVIKIDIDPSVEGSAEENVQLLAYRMAPDPADISPSRQRRHLNGNVASQ